MKARTRRRGELIWPTLIVKKWLNIKPNVDEFSQDESDNESYLEDDDSSSVEQNPFSDNENDNESNQTLFRCQTSGTPSKLLLRRLRRHKSETRRVQYIDTKEIKISVGTWNVAGRLPPDDLEIDKWLGIKEPADMYVLGFTEADAGRGFDRVRRTEIGKKHFKLTHFEEVFTTHHWMVCIYKLKPSKNRLRGKNKKRTKSSTKWGKYSSSKKQEKKNPWH